MKGMSASRCLQRVCARVIGCRASSIETMGATASVGRDREPRAGHVVAALCVRGDLSGRLVF